MQTRIFLCLHIALIGVAVAQKHNLNRCEGCRSREDLGSLCVCQDRQQGAEDKGHDEYRAHTCDLAVDVVQDEDWDGWKEGGEDSVDSVDYTRHMTV